jgi:GDPmannose 4,6-dehydratase
MWRMLQADEPQDYVLATGQSYTVRDFVVAAFEHAGLDWEKHVRRDERYVRPTAPGSLIGDASRARDRLGWQATTHTRELVGIMVDADLESIASEGEPWIDAPRFPAR